MGTDLPSARFQIEAEESEVHGGDMRFVCASGLNGRFLAMKHAENDLYEDASRHWKVHGEQEWCACGDCAPMAVVNSLKSVWNEILGNQTLFYYVVGSLLLLLGSICALVVFLFLKIELDTW